MGLSESLPYQKDLDTVIQGIREPELLYGKDIMVTGAGGMLGSFIVDLLLRLNDTKEAGIHVFAAGRSEAAIRSRFGKREDLVFVYHDLFEPVEFNARPFYLIHAAGYSDPAAFNNDPAGTVMGNVGGTYALLKYASEHGCRRFLYISSGEVYGQGREGVESFDESYSGYVDPLSARSCYPLSKRAAENLCASFFYEYGLDTVIVRPCHIFGPGFKKNDSHAYVQFLKNALKGEDIVMKSRGRQIRSYIYVADCVAGLFTALIRGEAAKAYNISDPASVISIKELAERIAKEAGVKVIFKEPDDMEKRDLSPIPKQVLDPAKLLSLGYEPLFGPGEGIGHTYSILKKLAD